MGQSDAGYAIVNGGGLGTRKTNHQIIQPHKNKIWMTDVETLTLADDDAKRTEGPLAKSCLDVLKCKHGSIPKIDESSLRLIVLSKNLLAKEFLRCDSLQAVQRRVLIPQISHERLMA